MYGVFKLFHIFFQFGKKLYKSLPGVQARCAVFLLVFHSPPRRLLFYFGVGVDVDVEVDVDVDVDVGGGVFLS